MHYKYSKIKELLQWKNNLKDGTKNWKGFSTFLRNPRGKEFADILRFYTKEIESYFIYDSITDNQRMLFLIDQKIYICPICEINYRTYTKPNMGFYTPTCKDKSCVDENRKKKIRDHYRETLNVDHYLQDSKKKEEYRKSYKDKTGYEHNWSNPDIRKKISEKRNETSISKKRDITNLNKYGTKDMFSLFMIPNLLENHGVNNAMKIDSVRKRNSLSNIENKRKKLITRIINSNLPVKLEGFKSNDKYEYEWDCNICNHHNKMCYTGFTFNLRSNTNPCIICNPLEPKYSSKAEKEVSDFLFELGIINERNRKNVLSKQETDMWIPSHKIIIEYNGLYWHSEIHKWYKYHQVKSINAKELGYRLIHIWEDDWTHKKDLVKNRLRSLFTPKKLFARKCKLVEITSRESQEFLESNHLQGNSNAKIRIGLEYENVLMGVMTFGKGRKVTKTGKDMYELERMAFKDDYVIIGGAQKMWKYFLNKYKPIEVFTYSLIEWNNDHSSSIYNSLDFSFVKMTFPNYWYLINGVRNHRYKFRKDLLVKQGFDAEKTEKEIMQERGITRLYDAGSFSWTWKKS